MALQLFNPRPISTRHRRQQALWNAGLAFAAILYTLSLFVTVRVTAHPAERPRQPQSSGVSYCAPGYGERTVPLFMPCRDRIGAQVWPL